MFQTTPYIWFLVVSRKLNTLLHQDLLLLNFPVTLIPFLLLPGGPSVGKPFLMIQVGGQKHQLWERTSPWILGRIKKTQRLGNGTKSSGWYKRWYLPYCHGNTNQQQKNESLLSPASLEKSTDYAPNKDHPKHGDKKVLVSVWTTQSVWSEWPTFGHGYSLLLVKCTGNILKIRNVAWNQRNPISKSTLQRILNPACSSGTAIHKRLRLFLSPPWRPAQSGAAQLEPSPQRHPPWNTKMWAIGNIWYTMI